MGNLKVQYADSSVDYITVFYNTISWMCAVVLSLAPCFVIDFHDVFKTIAHPNAQFDAVK